MVIKKLVRNWTQSRKDAFSLPTRSDPSLDDSRPIDTQEQEEIVRSLEKNLAQQSLLWRRIFAAIIFVFTVFLLYSITQQALFPWELRYHAYFAEDIDSWLIMLADGGSRDWVAVLACSMAIIGLLHHSNTHRQWIWYSLFTGTMLSVFWLYFMSRLPRFRWDVLWLPFGPLSGAGLCLYVDYQFTQSSEEIRKLRSYMYAYKAN